MSFFINIIHDMKKLTFVSHYFQFKTNIRLTDGKYHMLMHNNIYTPIELYYKDVDRVSFGLEPHIFSVGQIKKIKKAMLGSKLIDIII